MSKENENIQVVVIYQDSEEHSHPAQELSSNISNKEKQHPLAPINPQSEHPEVEHPKAPSQHPLSHHSEKEKQPSMHEEPVAKPDQHKQLQKEHVDAPPSVPAVQPPLAVGPNKEQEKRAITENNNRLFEQIIEVPVGNQSPKIEPINNEQLHPIKEVRVQKADPVIQPAPKMPDNKQVSDKKKNLNFLFEVAEDQSEPIIRSTQHLAIKQQIQPVKEEQNDSGIRALQSSHETTSQRANRIIGIIILSLLGGVFWIYGWASQFHVVDSSSSPVSLTTQSIYAGLLISTTIFTVIGFGLLLMFFKKTGSAALFTSLFIVSFTIIFSPIAHKYWYNIFVTDFSGTAISTQSPSYLLNMSMGYTNILLDLYNLKFSFMTSISQLVVILSMLGKLSYLQLGVFTFFYNFLWPLNHYAMINVQNKSPDPRFFDDYQISSVYLFGACFGTIAMLILKKPPTQQYLETSSFSTIFAHLGTFFLYLTFCSTTILFSQKNSDSTLQRNYVWQQGFINCFFALSASVLSTYTFSILFNDKIEARVSVFGVLMGGIIFGSVAGFCSNIGAAIACGFGAGLLANLYFSFIYYNLNAKRVIDNYGTLMIVAVSLIATVVIAPIVLITYRDHDVVLGTLQSSSSNTGTVIANKQVSGYSLTYPAISTFIGCGSGLILGLVLKLMDKLDANKTLTDELYFELSHGLRPTKPKERPQKKGSRVDMSKTNRKSQEKQLQKNRLSNDVGNSNPPVSENANLHQQDRVIQHSDGPIMEIVPEHSSTHHN